MKYILYLLPSFLLVIAGFSIKHFKAYWLISGYNTMSKQQKQNVDVKSLANIMSKFCYVLAFLILLIIYYLSINNIIIPMFLFILLFVGLIITMIKCQKYDKNALNEDGTFTKKTKITVSIVSIVLSLVAIGICFLFYFGTLPTSFEISNNSLKITGLYGESIPINTIKKVSILQQMPKINVRLNGSAIGNSLKGYFNVDKLGNVKLFIDTKNPPFIVLYKNNGKIVVISTDEYSKAYSLYGKLLKELDKS